MAPTTVTSLELLLLALVEEGCNTPYRLKEDAGISVGAALPALNRLKKRGLLMRAEQAARNKQEFEMTSLGKRTIASETKRLLAEIRAGRSGDTESVLRLAALALVKQQRRVAASLLKNAGLSRRQMTKVKPEERSAIDTTDLASIYRTMNEACAFARSSAEAEELIILARRLGQLNVRKS